MKYKITRRVIKRPAKIKAQLVISTDLRVKSVPSLRAGRMSILC